MTTRREIITSGLGLAGIIAAGRAPAAFVRSMVAARSAAFASFDKGDVPSGYTKLEYLITDGSAYIETDLYMSTEHRFETKLKFVKKRKTVKNYNEGSVFSDWQEPSYFWSAGEQDISRWDGGDNLKCTVGDNDDTNTVTITNDDNPHVFFANDSVCGIDTLTKPANWDHYPMSDSSILIGKGLNYETVGGQNGTWKYIYYVKFFTLGECVADIIPVLDDKSVMCFYDKVSKNTYYNIGHGLFYTSV